VLFQLVFLPVSQLVFLLLFLLRPVLVFQQLVSPLVSTMESPVDCDLLPTKSDEPSLVDKSSYTAGLPSTEIADELSESELEEGEELDSASSYSPLGSRYPGPDVPSAPSFTALSPASGSLSASLPHASARARTSSKAASVHFCLL
jgi:hypothetical protein